MFVVASKEWTIPPKAKAGRKPKKDPPKANEDVSVTNYRVPTQLSI